MFFMEISMTICVTVAIVGGFLFPSMVIYVFMYSMHCLKITVKLTLTDWNEFAKNGNR